MSSPADAIVAQHLAEAPPDFDLAVSPNEDGSFSAVWLGRIRGRGAAFFGIGPTREAAIVGASLTLQGYLASLPPSAPDLVVGDLGIKLERGQA